MADLDGSDAGRASPRQYPPELKQRAVRMVLESTDRGDQHWWNGGRLHPACGDVPPAEYEAACWTAQQVATAA